MRKVNITITGQLGAGKTALAKEIALHLAGKGLEVEYFDGGSKDPFPIDFDSPFDRPSFRPECKVTIEAKLPD